MDFEIVRHGRNGVEILETRTGEIPAYGELIEITVDGSDVEWYVVKTEIVNKRSGRVTRVTVNANEPNPFEDF